MDDLNYTSSLPDNIDFYKLFITTGWNEKYKLSKDELYSALKESWFCLSAYRSDQLVGFGRIICDGKVHALILDLIVLTDFQNQGIGGQILDKLVEKCKEHQIRDIQLFCAKGYGTFYEKRGFVKRSGDAPGMEYTNPTF